MKNKKAQNETTVDNTDKSVEVLETAIVTEDKDRTYLDDFSDILSDLEDYKNKSTSDDTDNVGGDEN